MCFHHPIFSLLCVNVELDILLRFSIVHSENENALHARKHKDAAETCDACVVSYHSFCKNKKHDVTHTVCLLLVTKKHLPQLWNSKHTHNVSCPKVLVLIFKI